MNYNDWRQNWRKKYENGENLPELWERRISKTYSTLLKQLIFYYKNMITNEVQWEDPRKEKECSHVKNEKITTTEKNKKPTIISDNDNNKDNSCPSRDKTPHPPVDKSDYRKELLIFHPDKNTGCPDDAEKKFKILLNLPGCSEKQSDEEKELELIEKYEEDH